MKVLLACEESQAVCKEFRARGHEAYSADIQECSGGHHEWHIQGDVTELLQQRWDMIIAFPPCTYLTNGGAVRMYPKKGVIDPIRFEKAMKAKEFFMKFYEADCPRIVIENPMPMKCVGLPEKTQVIQPYEYGDPFSKRTYLWIKGLPKLTPTNIIDKTKTISWVSGGSKDHKGNKRKNCGMKFRDSKTKSKTFAGIAKAMADQWG